MKQLTLILKRASRGFTFVETMVAIVIFTLIIGMVFAFIVILFQHYKESWRYSVSIEEARRGIEIMVREIRTARPGQDGSYPIEKAEDKEFIFYSDINRDGNVERVRYFLGTVGFGNQVKECETFGKGGSCEVYFNDFLQGDLISAQVKVSADGDLGWNDREYADIYANAVHGLGRVCRIGCSDCLGDWQGAQTFDVTSFILNDNVSFLAQATFDVDPDECAPHAMKVKFEFSWTEDLGEFAHEFKKGVIKPVTDAAGRVSYPSDQEEVSPLTSHVRNVPPIFKYFDQNGEEITETPARLKDTKAMEVHLIVNVDPDQSSKNFELKSAVQLRNLKEEY